MKNIIYSPLSLKQDFEVSFDGKICLVNQTEAFAVRKDDSLLKIETASELSHHRQVALEFLLGHDLSLQSVQINNEKSILRSEFYQLPQLWHHQEQYKIFPEVWTKTNDRPHPVRPKAHSGLVYKRYVPQIEATVSLRLTDVTGDLDTFHEWHNQVRVSFFWELNQPKEELKAYMEKGLSDPHQIPMIIEINGESVGYFEMYWVREDRLGPYYESDAFDRGFHFLIGNKKFLGHKITDNLIKCALHFLFLDDPRTRRIMAEPRHDNQKVLKYAEASIGWRKVKIFDFPHKRAWLLENSREIFFGGNAL